MKTEYVPAMAPAPAQSQAPAPAQKPGRLPLDYDQLPYSHKPHEESVFIIPGKRNGTACGSHVSSQVVLCLFCPSLDGKWKCAGFGWSPTPFCGISLSFLYLQVIQVRLRLQSYQLGLYGENREPTYCATCRPHMPYIVFLPHLVLSACFLSVLSCPFLCVWCGKILAPA